MKNQARSPGFALVATISIMVLIVLVALAMLTLSTTAIRTQQTNSAQAEAQANARMALMLAIGELQQQMGPDQRISANGRILDDPSTTVDEIMHPYWLGVWDAWVTDPATATVNADYPSGVSHHQTIGDQPDDSMRPDYSEKNKHFRRWLLSLDTEDARNPDSVTALGLSAAVMPQGDDTAVYLVGEGSLGSNEDNVSARLLNFTRFSEGASGVVAGRYAWWVGDESQKARVMEDSYNDQTLSSAEKIFRSQAPGSLNNKVTPGLENIVDESELAKAVTHGTINMLDGAADTSAQRSFHNATLFSRAVLADVREGGLKRDLSTILSQPIDPEDVYNVQDYFAYQRLGSTKADGDDYMLYSFDGMVTSQSTVGEASVPIQDLAAYYQLYDRYRTDWQQTGVQYSSSESSPSNTLLSNGIMVSTPDFGLTNSENEKYLRGYTSLYRQAVPVKIEYILHYATRLAPPDPDDPDADPYELKIGFSPAITLWNPTNLPMVMNFGNPEDNALMIREHPMELDLTFSKSDSYDGAPFETKTVEFNRVTSTQHGELYTVFISGKTPVVLAPGESRVFSLQVSSNYTPSEGEAEFDLAVRGRVGNRYAEPYIEQLELVPGWNPEKFLIPTTDAGGSRNRAKYVITFKDGDFISTKITAGHGKTFSTDFAPKGRHGSNKPGVQWVFRSSRIGGRIVEGNAYQRSQFHRDAINMGLPQASGIADAVAKEISLPARSASTFIDAMQDPTDPSDDLPQTFFYYGMMAGVETHESNQTLHGAGGGRRFPSRPFLHSSPMRPVMVDKLTGQDLYSQGWNWFFMSLDNYLGAPISISNDNHGYFGGGYTADNGSTHVIQQQLPLTPPISIATLSHAHLGGYSLAVEPPWVYDRFPPSNIRVEGYRRTTANGFDGLAPHVLQAVGNSYAHPNIDKAKAVKDWGRLSSTGWNVITAHPEPFVDHSYLANKALWDEYYFSSITPYSSSIPIYGGSGRSVEEVANDFFFGQLPLPNRRISPYSNGLDDTKLTSMLATRDQFRDGFADQIAAHLLVDGPFNINSTSVDAWKALFSSLKGKAVVALDKDSVLSSGTTLQTFDPQGQGTPIGTGPYSENETYTGSSSDPSDSDQWTGTRELTDTEIEQLAAAMVKQVKLRGPFLSLSEFVNRRLDSSSAELSVMGALQAAIDDPDCSINEGFRGDMRTFSASEQSFQTGFNPEPGITGQYMNTPFPEALEGAIAYGSRAYVDQADVLQNFAAQLTPRGDTFVIRAYGDSIDSTGNVRARAWCEAVVQRVPVYLDPNDEDHKKQKDLTSSSNKNFGRRFHIVKFRWLDSSEV